MTFLWKSLVEISIYAHFASPVQGYGSIRPDFEASLIAVMDNGALSMTTTNSYFVQ
jgi:hypothetical protein